MSDLQERVERLLAELKAEDLRPAQLLCDCHSGGAIAFTHRD
jgi:hypothetical protein